MAGAADYLQFSFLVPVGATIAGWFVVARQTDRREFRKEVREQIKELRASTDEVRDRATEYWLRADPKSASVAAVSLKAELKRMARLAQAIASAGLDFQVADRVADVRRLATGGDFETKNRKRNAADDADRITDIVGALEDLLTAVDAAFYTIFKAPRSSKLWRWLPLGGALLLTRD